MTVGFYVYNKLFDVARARMLIVDQDGRILLVQHWARGEAWSLPGGGINKNETPIQAARRELREELGVELPGERFTYLATAKVGYEAPLFVVRARADEIPERAARRFEIIDLQWFTPEELPTQLSKVARLGLLALSK